MYPSAQYPRIEGREPAQKSMLLESEGLPAVTPEGIPIPRRERFTSHAYDHSVIEPDPDLGDLSPQVAHVFRCRETGALRKYGVEALKEIN